MGMLRLLKNPIAMTHKAILGVWTHGQTSLTVPPFVVNLNFFNSPRFPSFYGADAPGEHPGGESLSLNA